MDEDGDLTAFHREIRDWLDANPTGEFATARGPGGPGREHEAWAVVISDSHERRLGEAAERLTRETHARPLAVGCDVTREDQVRALFSAAVERHGRIDVAVNNAGLGGAAELTEMTDEQWNRVLDVTLTGAMRCTRAALRCGR